MRIKILELFTTNSKCCIWNSIDCPNIHTPDYLESYIKKTGRVGRNRSTAVTLLETKGWEHYVDDGMKNYIEYTDQSVGKNCFLKLYIMDIRERAQE